MTGPLIFCLVVAFYLSTTASRARFITKKGLEPDKEPPQRPSGPWWDLVKAQGWRFTRGQPRPADEILYISAEIEGVSFDLLVSGGRFIRPGDDRHVADLTATLHQPCPPEVEFTFADRGWKVQHKRRHIGLLQTQGPAYDPSMDYTRELVLTPKQGKLSFSLVSGPEQGLQRLKRLIPLVAQVRAAELSQWSELAQQAGRALRFDAQGRHPRLSLSRHGVGVRAALERRPHGLRTRVYANLQLPFSFRIQHINSGSGPSVKLHHPIADSFLHVQTQAPDALTRLLSEPAVIQGVMAVCHGHPGSVVSQDGIELLDEGDSGGELDQAIEHVSRLAQAMNQIPSESWGGLR